MWLLQIYYLTQSYRLAEASLVTPIKYLSLVFAIFFGFLIWSEIPKLLTFLVHY